MWKKIIIIIVEFVEIPHFRCVVWRLIFEFILNFRFWMNVKMPEFHMESLWQCLLNESVILISNHRTKYKLCLDSCWLLASILNSVLFNVSQLSHSFNDRVMANHVWHSMSWFLSHKIFYHHLHWLWLRHCVLFTPKSQCHRTIRSIALTRQGMGASRSLQQVNFS